MNFLIQTPTQLSAIQAACGTLTALDCTYWYGVLDTSLLFTL